MNEYLMWFIFTDDSRHLCREIQGKMCVGGRTPHRNTCCVVGRVLGVTAVVVQSVVRL